MNLRMGGQTFQDVDIPLLWGERAVIQDRKGRLSVLDLSGDQARLEILADEPAPGVAFRPRVDGLVILGDGVELYSYSPSEKLLVGISLELPDCQISPGGIRVGTNRFLGSFVSGSGVGIAVRKNGIALGAPVPAGLAKLVI